MEIQRIAEGVRRFRTPCYLFDLDQAAEGVRAVRALVGSGTGLCYAMKANPFLVRTLSACTDRIEVCSTGEYRIARACGIAPEKLLISGVLKTPEDLREIVTGTEGRAVYTVESPRQYDSFSGLADELGVPLCLYLRLTAGDQFGMSGQTVRQLLRKLQADPRLQPAGIHFFSGTQKRKSEVIREELRMLDEFLCGLEAEGLPVPSLEYGPGIPVPYFAGDGRAQTREMLRQAAEGVRDMTWRGEVFLEMGRALAAECGCYLTSVCDCKDNGDERVCITDGGIHQMNYDGQMKGMRRPEYALFSRDGERREEREPVWDVYGSLCTVNDILCRDLPLGEPQIGDVLAFGQTGAYSVNEGMALLLSHELPGVAAWSRKSGWRVLREQTQTWPWNTEREFVIEEEKRR